MKGSLCCKLALLPGVLFTLMIFSCSERSNHTAADSEREWREQKETFESHLSRIETGWSKSDLVAHAGPPDEESADGWFYQWEESRVHGGEVSYYSIRFDGDTISEIKKGHAHVSKTPPDE